MDVLDIAKNIKALRLKKGMTLDSLAAKTGTTKGFLSQLENYRALLSLPLLYKIADALETEPSELLKSLGKVKTYVLTKKDKGVKTEREHPESGFIYYALAREKAFKLMDPFMLEIPAGSTRKNVTTNGDEFVYILEGEITFVLDTERIKMKKGDSIYFDGSIPHHSENTGKKCAKLLVIYALKD